MLGSPSRPDTEHPFQPCPGSAHARCWCGWPLDSVGVNYVRRTAIPAPPRSPLAHPRGASNRWCGRGNPTFQWPYFNSENESAHEREFRNIAKGIFLGVRGLTPWVPGSATARRGRGSLVAREMDPSCTPHRRSHKSCVTYASPDSDEMGRQCLGSVEIQSRQRRGQNGWPRPMSPRLTIVSPATQLMCNVLQRIQTEQQPSTLSLN